MIVSGDTDGAIVPTPCPRSTSPTAFSSISAPVSDASVIRNLEPAFEPAAEMQTYSSCNAVKLRPSVDDDVVNLDDICGRVANEEAPDILAAPSLGDVRVDAGRVTGSSHLEDEDCTYQSEVPGDNILRATLHRHRRRRRLNVSEVEGAEGDNVDKKRGKHRHSHRHHRHRQSSTSPGACDEDEPQPVAACPSLGDVVVDAGHVQQGEACIQDVSIFIDPNDEVETEECSGLGDVRVDTGHIGACATLWRLRRELEDEPLDTINSPLAGQVVACEVETPRLPPVQPQPAVEPPPAIVTLHLRNFRLYAYAACALYIGVCATVTLLQTWNWSKAQLNTFWRVMLYAAVVDLVVMEPLYIGLVVLYRYLVNDAVGLEMYPYEGEERFRDDECAALQPDSTFFQTLWQTRLRQASLLGPETRSSKSELRLSSNCLQALRR